MRTSANNLFPGQVPLERVEHEAEIAKQTNVPSGDPKRETGTASGLEDPIFGPSLQRYAWNWFVFQPLTEICVTFQAANSSPLSSLPVYPILLLLRRTERTLQSLKFEAAMQCRTRTISLKVRAFPLRVPAVLIFMNNGQTRTN